MYGYSNHRRSNSLPTSYAQCFDIWNTRKRKLANNTYLERIDPPADASDVVVFAIKLHSTHIVRYYPSGVITLYSGGYRTSTTKARINDCLRGSGYRVYTDSGVWYLCSLPTDPPTIGRTVGFAEGLSIYPNGHLYNYLTIADTKALKQWRKRARVFADAYIKELVTGKIEAPGLGDCFICQAGQGFGGSEHIKSHIAEKYYVPRLLVLALERFPVSDIARNLLAYAWNNPEGKVASDWERRIGIEQCTKSLYRYLCEKLTS